MNVTKSQLQRAALLATAIAAFMGSMAWGQELYQTHTDGSIWEYTGTPCRGKACPGWLELDNNPNLKMIAAGGGALYELHNDGSIWWYVGPPCSGGSCPGWVEVDNNPLAYTIGAGPNNLYEAHTDGTLWGWTGVTCNGGYCPGWTELSASDPAPTPLYAANSTLLAENLGSGYAQAADIYYYSGTPFDWPALTPFGAKSIAVDDNGALYALQADGKIWWFVLYVWEVMSQDPETKSITAGGSPTDAFPIYQQKKDHSIWQLAYCSSSSATCTWQELDNHAASGVPVAGYSTVYQIRKSRTGASIWQYTGTPCTGGVCRGWVKLDDNFATTSIVAGPQEF